MLLVLAPLDFVERQYSAYWDEETASASKTDFWDYQGEGKVLITRFPVDHKIHGITYGSFRVVADTFVCLATAYDLVCNGSFATCWSFAQLGYHDVIGRLDLGSFVDFELLLETHTCRISCSKRSTWFRPKIYHVQNKTHQRESVFTSSHALPLFGKRWASKYFKANMEVLRSGIIVPIDFRDTELKKSFSTISLD